MDEQINRLSDRQIGGYIDIIFFSLSYKDQIAFEDRRNGTAISYRTYHTNIQNPRKENTKKKRKKKKTQKIQKAR